MINLVKVKKISLIALLSFFSIGNISAQEKPDIQYVEFQDTLFVHILDSLITQKEQNDSLFKKGFGYFSLKSNSATFNGKRVSIDVQMDTIFQYNLKIFYNYSEGEKKHFSFSSYPMFFSLLNNRLILIDSNYWDDFSERSKKMFVNFLSKNLLPKNSPYTQDEIDEIDIYYLQNLFEGPKSAVKAIIKRRKVPYKITSDKNSILFFH